MTLTEKAERQTESRDYHSPVWFTLSGEARVSARPGSYRAELRMGHGWAVVNDETFATLTEAAALAVSADRFAGA